VFDGAYHPLASYPSMMPATQAQCEFPRTTLLRTPLNRTQNLVGRRVWCETTAWMSGALEFPLQLCCELGTPPKSLLCFRSPSFPSSLASVRRTKRAVQDLIIPPPGAPLLDGKGILY
jgi:hypothetical protein